MKKLLIIGLSAALFACTKDQLPEVSKENQSALINQTTELTPEEAQSLERLSDNHLIPENEILEQAKLLASTPNEDNCQLKSESGDLFIANSSKLWCKISSDNLKSLNGKKIASDSLPLSIFNLSNSKDESKGFVIISGDRRLPGIIARSESGSINDTASNPGIALYMKFTKEYLKNKLAEFNDENDSVLISALAKIQKKLPANITNKETKLKGFSIYRTEIRNRTQSNWTILEKYGPWLKTTWDQKYPYNKLLTPMGCSADGQPYPRAGCVAVAISQVLNFFQWPATLDNYTFNWNIMNEAPDCGPKMVIQNTHNYYAPSSNTSKDLKSFDNINDLYVTYDYTNVEKRTTDIANLLKIVGAEVGMNYTCDRSGAYAASIIPWMNNNGYYCGPMDYTNYNLVMHMKYAQPYVISGYSSSDGHVWAVDGFTDMQRTVNYDVVTLIYGSVVASQHYTTIEKQQLVHCNWGWGGLGNGDYATNALNVTAWNGHYYTFNSSVSLLGFWPQKPN